MKFKLLGLALCAAGLSGAVSASVFEGSSAYASINLASSTLDFLNSGVSVSAFSYSGPQSTASAQTNGGASISSVGTISAQANTTYAIGAASANAGNLIASAMATNGTGNAQASETLSFTVSGNGAVVLSIPYTLSVSATSSNAALWYSNASVGGSGITHNQSQLFSAAWDSLSSTNGGVQAAQVGDSLDFLVRNTGQNIAYSFSLGETATAAYTGDPAPVPEVPAPLMLSLGLIVPLVSRRSRKFLGL